MEASALQAPVGLARISLSAPLLRLRSDDQLLALFRAGNDEAFRVIHDRYHQRLFAYSRQMLGGSRQDAEDALQDVFIRAYAALRASDRPIALKAWLYRVAHNRCIDQLRRPLPAPSEMADVSRPPVCDPLAEAERRDDLARLVSDVRRLPEQQRSVLLMREMEGLSYADLAGALDVTVPAVKSLLVRARMGLVESAEARDTACTEIRHDLTLAHGRGVRATGRARRHLRDCAGCRDYRRGLRRVQRSFSALTPAAAGPLGLLAKLGIGGGGGGAGAGAAAAGGGAAAGGTIAGGGAAAVSAAKVAAVVSAVVVAGGGAVKVEQTIVERGSHTAAPAATAGAPATGLSNSAAHAVDAPLKVRPPTTAAAAPPPAETAPRAAAPANPSSAAADDEFTSGSGGMTAPDEGTPSGSTTKPIEAVPGTISPTTVAAPVDPPRTGASTGTAPGSGTRSTTGSGSGTTSGSTSGSG